MNSVEHFSLSGQNFHYSEVGKSLCDFSATPGAFAYTAANPSLCHSTKLKQHKSKRANEEDRNKKSKWGSLDRWRRRNKSKVVAKRRKSSNQKREGTKSERHVPRRRSTYLGLVIDTFKNVSVFFQSSFAHQMFQRSKAKESNGQNCQEIHFDKCAKGGPTKRIQPKLLHFLTAAAAVQCFMLEHAAIIQMLLVRSGIETNPGPPTPAVRYHWQNIYFLVQNIFQDYGFLVLHFSLILIIYHMRFFVVTRPWPAFGRRA